MIFDNPYSTYQPITEVDFQDFEPTFPETGYSYHPYVIPYSTPSEVEKEVQMWKYSRLTNKPAHFYQVKVGRNFLFGGRLRH